MIIWSFAILKQVLPQIRYNQENDIMPSPPDGQWARPEP